MFDKIIEKAIIQRCKEHEYLNRFKGLKVVSSKYSEMIDCEDGITLVKFNVVCTTTAKDYKGKVVLFQVYIYDNPKGEKVNSIGIYFNGTEYVA